MPTPGHYGLRSVCARTVSCLSRTGGYCTEVDRWQPLLAVRRAHEREDVTVLLARNADGSRKERTRERPTTAVVIMHGAAP